LRGGSLFFILSARYTLSEGSRDRQFGGTLALCWAGHGREVLGRSIRTTLGSWRPCARMLRPYLLGNPMRLGRFFLGLSALLLLVVACGQGPISNSNPTALPTASNLSVTPAPGTGIVVGTLLDQNTLKPPPVTILYLEKSFDHDVPPVLYGPLNNQPRVDTPPDGSFTFANVPPGEYILVLYSPIDIYYAKQSNGRALLVQVQDGQLTNLGQVVSDIP